MSELQATVIEATAGEAPAVAVAVVEPGSYLPARFDVDALAVGSFAAAGAGAADLIAARNGIDVPWVTVNARAAAASFVSERLFSPIGWELPGPWDPIAGDYAIGERWIRLHTNYESHRAAALSVLGCANQRSVVEAAVVSWDPVELEYAIVGAGGCAAVMHQPADWKSQEPLLRIDQRESRFKGSGPASMPFEGIRVLDLTRVIAGPVCTRFLAAYGAEVLRIDPPAFQEVAALVPETSAGKYCASLDLASPRGREVFSGLVAEADVLVCGLRPGALDRLGITSEDLAAINPELIVARLNAYGWEGPWRNRRGFDSLVQMSSGIAAPPDGGRPDPLPAQALDHATGLILAAAIGRALARRERAEGVSEVRCSLAGTANLLLAHQTPAGAGAPPAEWTEADTEPVQTEWGPARRVPVPSLLACNAPHLAIPPGPLGRHEAEWPNLG